MKEELEEIDKLNNSLVECPNCKIWALKQEIKELGHCFICDKKFN